MSFKYRHLEYILAVIHLFHWTRNDHENLSASKQIIDHHENLKHIHLNCVSQIQIFSIFKKALNKDTLLLKLTKWFKCITFLPGILLFVSEIVICRQLDEINQLTNALCPVHIVAPELVGVAAPPGAEDLTLSSEAAEWSLSMTKDQTGGPPLSPPTTDSGAHTLQHQAPLLPLYGKTE